MLLCYLSAAVPVEDNPRQHLLDAPELPRNSTTDGGHLPFTFGYKDTVDHTVNSAGLGFDSLPWRNRHCSSPVELRAVEAES